MLNAEMLKNMQAEVLAVAQELSLGYDNFYSLHKSDMDDESSIRVEIELQLLETARLHAKILSGELKLLWAIEKGFKT